MPYLERSDRWIPDIIADRLHAGLQQMLAGHRQWLQLDAGIKVAFFSCESLDGGKYIGGYDSSAEHGFKMKNFSATDEQ